MTGAQKNLLLAKIGEDLSGGLFGESLFPVLEELGKMSDSFLVRWGEVGFFVGIGDDVEEFFLGAVFVGDEFPLLVEDGVGDPVGLTFLV